MENFEIIPSTYANQNYDTECKRLLTYLKGSVIGEGFASIKSYTEGNGYVGLIVKPDKGIVVFKMIHNPNCDLDGDTMALMLNDVNFINDSKNVLKELRNNYLGKIMHAISLCVLDEKGKRPKFPIKFALVYQDFDASQIKAVDKKRIHIDETKIYLRNFLSLNGKVSIFENFEPCDESFNGIEEKYYGLILDRIIPEYATLTKVINKPVTYKSESKMNFTFSKITGQEREFSALSLDDSQIKTINETKTGPYITLANPGTGKSVILVSKAYRMYTMNPNSRILITCYNRNLCDHHSIFAQINGLNEKRIEILTFNTLVERLLTIYDKDFSMQFIKAGDFDSQIHRFKTLIEKRKIKPCYDAVFIDEVQLFDPSWIDMCYLLLKNPTVTGNPFEMYGDINQDVKSQRSKGKASWQNTKCVPSLKGRVRNLHTNYRNNEFIARYLNAMISKFNEIVKCYGIPVDADSACLTSETKTQGTHKPRIYPTSKEGTSKKVVSLIKMLQKKYNADINDIAVIYPAKSFGKFFTPLAHIMSELDANNIPFSLISGAFGSKVPLYATNGVILSTIDSSLGLDFKYIILCATHYWDYFVDPKTKKVCKFTLQSMTNDINQAHYFNEIGKKIYSAVSRARDRVFIIDDSNDDCVIKKIIMPKGSEDSYRVIY